MSDSYDDFRPLPDENERVRLWRLKTLLDAGYSVDEAEEISDRAEIDLHQAVELVERGCDPARAASILL